MKQLFHVCIVMVITIGSVNAQNNLLSGAITGDYPIIGAETYDIEFVYDGTDLVLVSGSYDTGELYAIDFNFSTVTDVHDWNTDSVPNIVSTIASLVGASATDLEVWEMKVNPKTKSAFLLMLNNSNSTTFLVEVKNPSDIAVVSLSNMTYSSVKYTSNNNYLYDMEWGGDSRFYFCTGDFTLDGEVGAIDLPFVHNSTAGNRATSVFKSNWGGGYFTNAPLEKISFSTVDGIDRLMGVTVCAPGFSIETSEIDSNATVLQVTEDFDVVYNYSMKIVTVTQEDSIGNTTTYLFDLHKKSPADQLIRIGEMYLDGSPVANNEFNNSAQKIRTTSGDILSDLTEEEAKIVATGFKMIAKYSEYSLMVIDNNDVLKLYKIGEDPQISGIDKSMEDGSIIQIYPNPTNNNLIIDLNNNLHGNIYYRIFSVDGQLIDESRLRNNQIDLKNYNKGYYIINLYQKDKILGKKKFIIN